MWLRGISSKTSFQGIRFAMLLPMDRAFLTTMFFLYFMFILHLACWLRWSLALGHANAFACVAKAWYPGYSRCPSQSGDALGGHYEHPRLHFAKGHLLKALGGKRPIITTFPFFCVFYAHELILFFCHHSFLQDLSILFCLLACAKVVY